MENNKPGRSNLVKHLLENKHNISNVKENIKILKYCENGKNKSSWEESYIHKNKFQNKNLLIINQTKLESKIIFIIKLYGKISYYIKFECTINTIEQEVIFT